MSPSLPWITLFVIVAASLYYKGYLRLPSFASTAQQNSTTQTPTSASDISSLSSHVLGMAFVKAKQREAQEELAFRVAEAVTRDVADMLSSPFPKPGADPQSPG